jgi:hypothetical protein
MRSDSLFITCLRIIVNKKVRFIDEVFQTLLMTVGFQGRWCIYLCFYTRCSTSMRVFYWNCSLVHFHSIHYFLWYELIQVDPVFTANHSSCIEVIIKATNAPTESSALYDVHCFEFWHSFSFAKARRGCKHFHVSQWVSLYAWSKWLLPDGVSWHFLFGICTKLCWHTPIFVASVTGILGEDLLTLLWLVFITETRFTANCDPSPNTQLTV